MPETDKELFRAAGAPTWRPRNAESIVEAAILCSPVYRYESAITNMTVGYGSSRVFRRLIDSGLMQYTEVLSSLGSRRGGKTKPALLEFTESGLAYVTEAIEERVTKLHEVQQSLAKDQSTF
ncbi:MAG TPA: hypothetical protein VLF90_02905 [Patescibacteria group bacterium]|nr:hypothetical protein [Patescibacteria group bacterium]